MAAETRRRAGRRLSVRATTTIAAILAFGLVLSVAALAALVAQRTSLRGEVAQAAAARADSLATALGAAVSPSVLVRVPDSDLVQVLGPDGAVLAESPRLGGAAPIRSDVWPSVVAIGAADGPRYLMQRAEITAGGLAGGSVIVGRSLAGADSSLAALGRTFAIGVPILILLTGLITWALTGLTLRPVERMRRRVEAISAANLDQGIPPPGGHDEVARLAETMNGMLERLQSAADSQRRFVSDASHELRSPLAVLRQSAELARDYPQTTTQAELAADVLAETDRMQRLVAALLLLARSDEHRLAPRLHEVDLADVLRDAARGRAQPPRLDLTGLTATPARADAQLLGQAVRNLIDNATRHTRTTVWLACRPLPNGGAELSVADDGAGIPAADRERVFDRFVRLDEARTRDAGGSGLGLAIVRQAAAAHHGRAVIGESAAGGARVALRLPDLQDADRLGSAG